MSYQSIDVESTFAVKAVEGGRKWARAAGLVVLLMLASFGVFTTVVKKPLTNAFTSMAALGNTPDGCVPPFARAAPARAGSRPAPRPL